jgi:hypothetical protein
MTAHPEIHQETIFQFGNNFLTLTPLTCKYRNALRADQLLEILQET